MTVLLSIISFVSANAAGILAAVNGLVVALIAIFAYVPGDQPEKALHAIADFIAKFSNKKE
jgi:hypothetical protein